MWQDRVREIVSRYSKKRLDDEGARRSAVLMLLYPKGGEPHVLLTKRTETVPQHKGQIAFPGGTQAGPEESLLETALRETREEVGIGREGVEILGELDDQFTVTNYVVTPFVALTDQAPRIQLSGDEIAFVLEIPIAALLDRSCFHEEEWLYEGKPYPAYFFDWGEHVVWGLTARVLKQFFDLLDWRLEPSVPGTA